MRVILAAALVASLGAGIGTQVFAQTAGQMCGDVEGSWSWSTGGVVNFRTTPGEAEAAPHGTAVWSPLESMRAVFSGDWHCDPESGAIQIVWQHGLVDDIVVNGDRIEGTNQLQTAFSGQRVGSEPPEPLPAGPIPPGLVGTWLLEVQLPSPSGPIPVSWSIGADGAYVIDAGPFSHAGQMNASQGRWEKTASTPNFDDAGTYQLLNWATLVTSARNGPGRWHRKAPELVLTTIAQDGQPLPAKLPELADALWPIVSSWRPDAELVSLEHRRADSNRRNAKNAIKLRYKSPASGAGLAVTIDEKGTGFFVHDVVRWSGSELPPGFLDLPTVWAIARQHGIQDPLDRAELRIHAPSNSDPILVWTITGARGSQRVVNLDGATGVRVDDNLSDYVDTYNEQWQRAAQGLRRLFARPKPSHTSSTIDWDSGGSSGSTQNGDDGGRDAWSDYDTASQNAWGSGDMQAYDRIQSGTATGEDCARFGC